MATSVQKRRHRHPWPRRAVDSPQQSIAVLALWLDGSDAASIIQTAGSINQWGDKSGTNNNATQATALKQPTVQVAAQNGLNTVRFTDTNSQMMNLTKVLDLSGGYSFAGVIRRGGPTGVNVVETLGASGQGWADSIEWYSDQTLIAYSATGFNLTPPVASTGYNAVAATVSGDQVSIWLNGVLQSVSFGADPVSRIAPFDRLGQADGTFCNGEIAELKFYHGILSSAAISELNLAHKAKWATP